MHVLTKKNLIENVCAAFKAQYYENGSWKYGESKSKIYYELVKLGDNKTEESIAQVIGNYSWTSLICDECEKSVDSVLVCCDNGEYETSICKECINKALKLFEV